MTSAIPEASTLGWHDHNELDVRAQVLPRTTYALPAKHPKGALKVSRVQTALWHRQLHIPPGLRPGWHSRVGRSPGNCLDHNQARRLHLALVLQPFIW